MHDRIRSRFLEHLKAGLHNDTVELAWGEPEDVLNIIWPDIQQLIEATDDLHSCINEPEYSDLYPETKDFILKLHTELHHEEMENPNL